MVIEIQLSKKGNEKMTFFTILCMALTVSTSQTMDVYDWRARTEWICAQSFRMLE